MLIYFRSKKWGLVNVKAGVRIDDTTKMCIGAAPSIAFLKGQTFKAVVQWAMQRADDIYIVHNPHGHNSLPTSIVANMEGVEL